MYDYDSNSIQAAVTKTRNSAEIRDALLPLLEKLNKTGHEKKLHIMDNEASDTLKKGLKKYDIAYQLVPPPISTAKTPQNVQFKHLRLTSSQLCVLAIQISRHEHGTD